VYLRTLGTSPWTTKVRFITSPPSPPQESCLELPLASFIIKGIKFAIAGGLGVIAGLAVQYVLTSILHVYYLESAIAGYGSGAIINYVGNILNGNIKLKQ
jgi:hypothetical protein